MEEKDLLELWKNANDRRNIELSHLWQRSVLLTALIVVICTVYFGLVSRLLDTSDDSIKLILHEIAGFMVLIGLIFSIIWTMMGKGSKAWYEVQEKRIKRIEEKLFGKEYDGFLDGDDCSLKALDICIFSCKAGKYSVSKLNIFIGVALSIIWIILFVFHFSYVCSFLIDMTSSCCHCWIAMGMILLFLAIIITASCNVWAKSSTLMKES